MATTVKTQRNWFLTLFSLPFLGVGIGFLFFAIIPMLHDAWRMASWPETQATLLQAQLITNRSSKSTTYDVTATYMYQVDGRDYQGQRVAISSGADNIGDFQQNLGSYLEQAYQSGQTVSVWYDPENPQDALLNRDLRWEFIGFSALFVLMFGGGGLYMMYSGLRGTPTPTEQQSQAQPWLKRPEWQSGVICCQAKTGLYVAWGFALFWNLISLPMAFFFKDIWQQAGNVALLALLFPFIGVILLIWAVKTTLEWRRFGDTPLTMDPFPGAIGGDVGGSLQINAPYDPAAEYEVTLSCLNSYVTGSGKNRSRNEKLLWQDKGYAEVQPAMRGIRLQFRFAVPNNLPASETHSDNYHYWRLNIHGNIPGIDLDRHFEIPVYPGNEKSRHIVTLSSEHRPAGQPEISAETLLPLTRTGSRIDIHYPMLRNPLSALGLLLFGGIFAAIGIFLWYQAVQEGFALSLMGSVFGLVGGLIIFAGFYALLNSLHISLDSHKLSAVRSILGIPVSSKTATYPEIRAIEIKQNGSSQSGNTHSANHQIIAKTVSGEMVLAEDLDSYSKAERVVEYLEKLSGLDRYAS